MEGILPLEILQKLVCYSIYTNEGTVKIVSEGNVEIVNGWFACCIDLFCVKIDNQCKRICCKIYGII